MDRQRGSGTTTGQMKNAPKNAIFVWHSDNTEYPKALARSIDRNDLKIVGPSCINSRKWLGLNYSAVVVDHYAYLEMTRETRLNVTAMSYKARVFKNETI